MRAFFLAIVACFLVARAWAGTAQGEAAPADAVGVERAPALGAPLHALTPSASAAGLPPQANPVHSGNPAVAPLKWVGMLINPAPTKDHPDMVTYCTGEFIKPNVVLTAAHCIKDLPANPTGPWYDLTKQTFVLQYQNGQGSQTFKTKCAATPPGWAYPANYNTLSPEKQDAAYLGAAQHDFALVLVDGQSPTGVMPYALDWKGKVTGATRVGYADDILDGQIIQDSYGIVFFADAIPMYAKSYPNLVVNWQKLTDLTTGTSGGAWIVNFNATEGQDQNVLVAVNSFLDNAYPGAMMASYLTAAEFNPLLTFVQNGCK